MAFCCVQHAHLVLALQTLLNGAVVLSKRLSCAMLAAQGLGGPVSWQLGDSGL